MTQGDTGIHRITIAIDIGIAIIVAIAALIAIVMAIAMTIVIVIAIATATEKAIAIVLVVVILSCALMNFRGTWRALGGAFGMHLGALGGGHKEGYFEGHLWKF